MSSFESRSGIVLELAEEFLERYRQGQRPSLKEYIDRHPDLAAEIKEVFPAMALMENVALADESLAGDATGPTTPTGSAPPQQLGDYRIIREVGRGGMGIVYEAEQVSLGRHVALKVLPRQMFVEDSQRRRFEREAKAAAKLHHTNIVPVFGVGEQDGMPYYVMQFIQGLGLDDVLDELKRMQSSGSATATGGELRVGRKGVSAADVARSLMTGEFQVPRERVEAPEPAVSPSDSSDSSTTGKLSDSFTLSSAARLPGSNDVSHGKSKKATYWQSVAQIGVQVAEALEYAHEQGILHRDIKPSNLLLDTRGTVWVTDFGLARAENEDHLTQTGDIVGTLRYMPPEAFEGRSDKRSDIYSLGLTLYELLTLQPAFAERDRHKLIKQVTTEEPARLDKVNRLIPRDLVTIVHKAIDCDAARRYQTAAELTADLQHFLDDEPIQARRVSGFERWWRWCRHHPGVASLTAILAVTLLSVTGVSVFVAEHETGLRKQAEEAKRQQETAKRQAEANFAQARKAVEESFTKVSESQLLQVPGMQPLRRELLQSALTFYQEFVKEHGDDPAIRGELAAAYLRVGKIRKELEEEAEARKALEQARELYEALTKAAPESVGWRHGLAECYYRLGRNEDAITLWEQLIQPGQPRFQKELAMAYNVRGNSHDNANRRAEAIAAHQQALTIREMLVRLNPEDAEVQRDLGITLNNIGVLLAKKDRLADALVMYRRAATHHEAAFARAPQVLANGHLVVLGQGNIAFIEQSLGHANEALTAFRRIVEVSQQSARDNPAIPSLHVELFNAYWNLALYQRELKQIEPYARIMHLAREALDRVPREGADSLFTVACLRSHFATFLGQRKEKPTAEEQAEQKREADLAVEMLRKAVVAGFRDVNRLRQAEELNPLRDREDFKAVEAGLVALLPAAPQDKLKQSQQALAQRQKLAQADPHNRRLQADLAASHHAMALIQLDLGKRGEARKHLEQELALREAQVKDEPNNAQYQADRTLSRVALGDLFWQEGQLAEAAKLWQSELVKLEAGKTAANRLIAADQLFAMRRTIAEHYARAGLWDEAAAQYGRLIPLQGATDDDYYRAACLALRAGDAAAYRRSGAQWLQQIGDSDSVFRLHYFTWFSSLAEDSGVKSSQFIQRSQKSTGGDLPNEWWRCHILGLAHYRAGQFAEAITQARRSSSFSAEPAAILNYPVLALAHHRLGQTAEARQWLDKTREEWRRFSLLQRAISSLTVLPTLHKNHWHSHWQDWVTFEILFSESSRVITGSAPAEEAYDHAHRGLLYSRLGDRAKAETHWQEAVKILPRDPMLWLVRARQLVEEKRRPEGETILAKIDELAADNPDAWKERGRLYFELGQTEKAAADFRKALALFGDPALSDEPILSEADKLFSQLALTAFIARNPDDMERRRKRGEWYARHWRWQEAAADFKMALQRNPPGDPERWLNVAPVLAIGDREGYRWLCREIKTRFGNTQDPTTADRVAKAALLLPEFAQESEWACALADRAVERGKNLPYWHYFRFCKGLADYRRGNDRAAIDELDSLLNFTNLPVLTTPSHLVLAMADHRQKDAKAARQHLAQGAKLVEQNLPHPARSATPAPQYNHDWLIAWLLHREAQTLIEGKKAESNK